MTKNTCRLGFTLVELTLSMAFIGILLMATVAVAIHFSSLYSKGIAMKSINQAGRELGDSIKRDAVGAAKVSAYYVSPATPGAGKLGRLCLGRYSYLWNVGDNLNTTEYAKYQFESTPIVMARILDTGYDYCKAPVAPATEYKNEVPKAAAQELLASDVGEYAIHNLQATRIPAVGTAGETSALFRVSYTIGTNDINSIDTVDRSCKPPNDANENFQFCSVNTFEIIARAEY